VKTTNKNNIPEIVIRAMHRTNAAYSRGDADISVTQLISPPRIVNLKEKHYKEMSIDASDAMFMLLGSAVHHIIEAGATDEIVEERLFSDVEGWRLSGAIDLQEEEGKKLFITDYKVTSAFKVIKGDYEDWVLQQNIYAWLIKNNKNRTVQGIRICAIIRDWTRSEIGRKAGYPKAPVVLIDLPVWPYDEIDSYVRNRIKLHQEARLASKIGYPLPDCTISDQWGSETKYAIKKKGAKRATKLYTTREQAELELEDGYEIEPRPGRRARCEGDYCGVAKWCNQFKRERERSGK